jgi:hypothetical protein
MNKLLEALFKRMDNIFDKKERIFQERYEIQGQKAVWSENETDEERQLTLELHKVFEAIDRELKRQGFEEYKKAQAAIIPPTQVNLGLDR